MKRPAARRRENPQRAVRRWGRVPIGSVVRQTFADAAPLGVAVMVVALVTSLTAAVPRLADRVATDEIRTAVEEAGSAADVVVRVPFDEGFEVPRPLWPDTAGGANYDAWKVGEGLPDVFAPPVTAIVSNELGTGKIDDRPGRLRFAYVAREGATEVVWVEGRAPEATATFEEVEDSKGQQAFPVEVALSADVAAALEVTAGETLHLTYPDGRTLDVPVTGVFAPVDSRDPIWTVAPTLLEPKVVGGAAERVELSAMVTAGSLPFARLALKPGAFTCTDTFAVQPDLLDGTNAGEVAATIRTTVAAPNSLGLLDVTPSVNTRLDTVLESALARIRSATAQASMILVGVLATAGAVLLLASGLVVQRRFGVLAHQRAHGGSLPAIAWGLTRESVALTGVGAAIGLVVASRVVSGPTSWPWVAPPLIFAAVAGPALGVRAAARTSAPPPALRLDPRTGIKAAEARRFAAEAAVVVLTVGAFAALRSRGVTASGDSLGADLFVLAAPALAAGVVALALLRVLPPFWRWVRRTAERTRGAAPVLAAARTRIAGLPLVALVLGTSLFTATLAIDATVRSGELAGSWQSVGADVVATADSGPGLPAEIGTLPGAPGVDAAAAARIAPGTQLLGDGVNVVVRVVAVDAADLEALLAASPLRDAPQLALLSDAQLGTATTSLPALVAGVPVGATGLSLRWEDAAVSLSSVGAAPAMPGDGRASAPTVIVDRTMLARAIGVPVAPDILWVDGEGAEQAVRGLAGMDDATITTRADWLAARRAAPVTAAFGGLLVGAAVVLIALAVLVVSLVAAASARGRATALAGFRVLGLPRGQGGRVAVGELVVPVLIGGIVGTATGVGLAWLLVGPLDLGVLTGQTGSPDLVLPWWCWASIPALVAAVLVAVAVELAGHRRERLGQVMRAG